MNLLNLLRGHRADVEAEADAAEWIDNQPILRPVAAFLAHHRTLHTAASVAIGAVLAPVAVVATVAAAAGSTIDAAHEAAGEGTKPCQPCIDREADEFAGDGQLTYEDVVNAWDLKDGGLA